MRRLALVILIAATPVAASAQAAAPSAVRRALADSIATVAMEDAPSPSAMLSATPAMPGGGAMQEKLMKAMGTFIEKYFPAEMSRRITAEHYAETFSEAELRTLLAFYRSDLGRKLQKSSPALIARIQKEQGEVMTKHMGEFQAMMMKLMQEP